MNSTPIARKTTRHHGLTLAAIAAAALVVGGCSKNGTDTSAAADTPAPVVATAPAANPAVATTAPATPSTTVIAQNESQAYRDGRRDEAHAIDHRRDERPLPPRTDRDGEVAPDQRVAAVACPDCGVIESFDTVRVQGDTNGVGAVAGGVGGAVIGNRIAGRGNHTLGGVVGAIGGGLIGNAVEKHERATEVYDVHVRMADGSSRTVRQGTPPTVGAQVRVEADGLHARS